jgi:pilus assembly protein Flp/PilA
MRRLISRLMADERGATVIEYGLICALIFLVAVGAITAFGNAASGKFVTIASAVSGVMK